MTSTNLSPPPQRPGVSSLPWPDPDALRARARAVGIWAFLAVAAVLVGWLVANGHTKYAAAVLVPIPVLLVVLTARAAAPLAGVLVLLVMNGLPVVSLGGRLPGGVRVQDVAVISLALVLYLYRDRSKAAQTTPYTRAVKVWSALLIAWWSFTVARTILIEGVPIRFAALYGRDFLYFAILLPLALGARLPARSVRIAAKVVLGGTAVYALGYAVAGLTGHTLSWLVHPAIVAEVVGQTRFYSPMNYVVDSAVIFAAALLFSKGSPGNRWVVGGLFVLFALAAALGLTRANYFGLIVAVVAIAVVYAIRHGSVTAIAGRLAIVILVAAVGIGLFTAIAGQSGSLGGNPVASRVSTGLTDITKSTGTFGYRKHLDQTLLTALGAQWPIGLGFLHPGVHPVAAVPSGSIRNSDTGALAILMTMGFVGFVLMYAPPIYAFRELLRVSRRPDSTSQPLPRWILYGGAGWLAWAVAGSVTLIVLCSVPGLILTTLVLTALGWAIRASTSTSPTGSSESTRRQWRPVNLGPSDGGQVLRLRESARAPVPSPARRPPSLEPPSGRRLPHSERRPPSPLAPRPPSPRTASPSVNGRGDAPVVSAPGAGALLREPDEAAQRSPSIPLTAVIVTYNSAHCISGSIAGVRTALGDCEVLVVDNKSTDDTIEIVAETDARVRVVEMGRNAGFGAACNAGVQAATNEHVIFINPDVRVQDADLEALRARFEQAPLGLVALSMRGDDQTPAHPQTFARSTWWGELTTMALGPFRPRELPQRSRLVGTDSADWAAGALILVRRSEFLDVGGFDERFFLYYEDQELGIRYRDAGLPIVGSDAVTGAHTMGHSSADDDQRVTPTAWCLLGWLELVAMQHGRRRAKLSWRLVETTHRVGSRLADWGASTTGLTRLHRKAEQLRAVDAKVVEIARAGALSEHESCPAACRVVHETSGG